jgi:hypothetical protein
MDSDLSDPDQPVDRIERVAIASTVRMAVAALTGITLWLAILIGGFVELELLGDDPSDFAFLGAVVGSGLITVFPAVLSQFTRGQWVLENMGLQESHAPLIAWLPFGLYRERFIRWQDVETFHVREFTLRQKGTTRVMHFFEASIHGQPDIQITRKEKPEDPIFDGFVAEFSRRMAG